MRHVNSKLIIPLCPDDAEMECAKIKCECGELMHFTSVEVCPVMGTDVIARCKASRLRIHVACRKCKNGRSYRIILIENQKRKNQKRRVRISNVVEKDGRLTGCWDTAYAITQRELLSELVAIFNGEVWATRTDGEEIIDDEQTEGIFRVRFPKERE